jgi:hypothetical protein
VSLLVLSVVFVLTVAIGAALARGILGLVLRVVVSDGLPSASTLRTAAMGLLALMR